MELVALAYDGQARVWQHVVWVQSVLSFQAALSLLGLAFTGPRFRVAARVLVVAAFLSLSLFNPITGFEPTVPGRSDLLWNAFVFAPSLLAIASAGLALRDGAAGWARALLLVIAAVLFAGNALLVPGWVEAAN
ncbi:hypothetical protein JOD31_002272 [Methylopila capsulata]|nr:hypothetical protein [Methylopila capsulata]MBM7852030.1 hypothetical protein [Methylopila capsulata]